MDGKSQAAVLRGPATPTLAAANASRVLASAPRTDFLLEYTGLSDWPKGPKPWNSHTKQSKRVNDSRARSTLVSAVGSQHYYCQLSPGCDARALLRS